MSTGLVDRVGELIGIKVIAIGESQAALHVILQQKWFRKDLDGLSDYKIGYRNSVRTSSELCDSRTLRVRRSKYELKVEGVVRVGFTTLNVDKLLKSCRRSSTVEGD